MVWTRVEDISTRVSSCLSSLFVLPRSRQAPSSSFFFLPVHLHYLHPLNRRHGAGSSLEQFRRPERRRARSSTGESTGPTCLTSLHPHPTEGGAPAQLIRGTNFCQNLLRLARFFRSAARSKLKSDKVSRSTVPHVSLFTLNYHFCP